MLFVSMSWRSHQEHYHLEVQMPILFPTLETTTGGRMEKCTLMILSLLQNYKKQLELTAGKHTKNILDVFRN
uniref:Uncharacterized protein n=1 Tax=Arundo donax TaxID=35708 RepID=A0A0A9CIH7_ARUDO